jgi:hypothetical protein
MSVNEEGKALASCSSSLFIPFSFAFFFVLQENSTHAGRIELES